MASESGKWPFLGKSGGRTLKSGVHRFFIPIFHVFFSKMWENSSMEFDKVINSMLYYAKFFTK